MDAFRAEMSTKWSQHYDQAYVLGSEELLVLSFFQNGSNGANREQLENDALEKAKYAFSKYRGDKKVSAVQIEYRIPDIRSLTMEATATKFRFAEDKLK